jgi:serine/threonine protein phosphatase 1
MPKTFVIADIHGCHDALQRLLARINPDPGQDTLVFLGDYINRGPDSRQVIETLLLLRRTHRHVITLMGNHEQMLLAYLAGREQELFLTAGGIETLESYGITNYADIWTQKILPAEHLDFLHSLPACWEDEEFIYVHAALEPGVHLACQKLGWLLWGRSGFIDSDHDFGKRVIYGHTPRPLPRIEANKIGLDTGAVYGGALTCLILPELEFVSVKGFLQGDFRPRIYT